MKDKKKSGRSMRRLLVTGAFGAAVGYVALSPQARRRLAAMLRQAWQRSVEAARAVVGDWTEQPTEAEWERLETTRLDEPEPARSAEPDREVVVEPPVLAATGAPPETPGDEREPRLYAVEGIRVAVPAGEEALEDDGDARASEAGSADLTVGPETGEAPGAGDPALSPSRRRWARLTAAAAILAAAAAIAAVSWAVWDTRSDDDGDGARTAAPASSASGGNILAAVSAPNAKRIPVAGSGGKVILVVAPDGRAALIVSGFKRAPRGKQFEAWVITGKQAKRAGLFSGGPGYIVVPLTQSVPRGATVAVTLERAGGVDAPTSKPLFAATHSS